MTEEMSGLFKAPVESSQEAMALLTRLTDVAQPGTVYGEPVTVGEHTVFTASEVSVGLGYGYAMGGGSAPAAAAGDEGEAGEGAGPVESGAGGGGGGGGSATARPVAVIQVGPEGVRVEPVVDVTKISLAFLTMLGSVFLLARKMRRGARNL
jgi:uncharacterized spore protein YtfJ